MAKLICGCGYLGLRVARRWLARGEVVWATTRSAQRAARLKDEGIEPIVTDVTQHIELPNQGTDIDTVLFALGFDRSPGQSVEEVYLRGLESVLQYLPALNVRLPLLIYISSTGVYEHTQGEWVDETTPCHPVRASGRACWQAERRLAESSFHGRSVILRLAGLYGPDRLPKRAAIQAGVPIEAVAEGYLNLIHVEDAADAAASVPAYTSPPNTLNVSDGHPVLRREFYQELARLVHAPPPQFVPPTGLTAFQVRGSTDKRVSNRKFMSLYGRALRYPTYREGLAATVQAG